MSSTLQSTSTLGSPNQQPTATDSGTGGNSSSNTSTTLYLYVTAYRIIIGLSLTQAQSSHGTAFLNVPFCVSNVSLLVDHVVLHSEPFFTTTTTRASLLER